jgi:hypothetical protein
LGGKKDELVPPSQLLSLYRTWTKHTDFTNPLEKAVIMQLEDKWLSLFEDGTHNDTCMQPGYIQVLEMFIQRYLMTT